MDQLDIFDNSRDVMLRNDVIAALQNDDAAAAGRLLLVLVTEYPDDRSIAPLQTMLLPLEEATATPFVDHDAAAAARDQLLTRLEAAAVELLGRREAIAWLARRWKEMAYRAASLSFRPDRGDCHAAPFWLRAGDWTSAVSTVERIESWRRIPAPLAWMCEATYRLTGMEAAWPMMAELAWLSAERLDALARRLADPSLDALLARFSATFDGNGDTSDLCWFPAWALVEKTGIARWLAQAQPSRQLAPERAMRLILDLLNLERHGRHHDLVERRKVLRDLSSPLYATYMKTR
ncbi:hypothetical protein [Paraburkholderia sp. BCC1885]|uniref:hypothetical protein n=1 Tax=Paraburkholderia sp. BCC1885 TaxID=2562669 RepID=UPI0011829E70|nr:hypothetical protein [Paraburkholderia sp. BCC1885]